MIGESDKINDQVKNGTYGWYNNFYLVSNPGNSGNMTIAVNNITYSGSAFMPNAKSVYLSTYLQDTLVIGKSNRPIFDAFAESIKS